MRCYRGWPRTRSRDLIAVIPTCKQEQREEVEVMLNRLASLGTAALRFRRPELFDPIVLTGSTSRRSRRCRPRRTTAQALPSGASCRCTFRTCRGSLTRSRTA